MNRSDFMERELARLSREGLLRRLPALEDVDPPYIVLKGSGPVIDFCSNDYLGLSCRRELKEASCLAASRWGAGSRASRLLSGDHPLYQELERSVSRLKGTEACLVLGSGYLANTGIIPAVAAKGDLVLADRQIHASLIDGIRLSGARLIRFPHNDLRRLEELLEGAGGSRRVLVAVESLYSMDGDLCPLEDLLALKEKLPFILLVDEAHAVGLFGAQGEGLIPKELAPKVDLIIGTFGKALGSYGAFCGCSGTMRQYLVNRCRTVIFSTALPPGVLAASARAVEMLSSLNEERTRVLEMSRDIARFIRDELGISVPGQSQIVSLIVGSSKKALELESFLLDRAMFARAIRPPTVAKGTERIRFSITAAHKPEHLEALKAALREFF